MLLNDKGVEHTESDNEPEFNYIFLYEGHSS